MLYLVQTFAIPLLAALAGGLAVGWITSDKDDEGPSGWAAFAATVFALAVVAAALKWLPGRPGLWLDTAVLFASTYLAGCIVGAFARVFTDKVEEMATEPLTQAVAAGQALVSTLEPAKAAAQSAAGLAGSLGASVSQAAGNAQTAVSEAAGNAVETARTVVNEAAEKLGLADEGSPQTPAASDPPEDTPPSRAASQAKPANGAAAAAEAMAQGVKPQGIAAARDGKPDDLKMIRGIGPQNEARLHALGIWHFDQIAKWVEKEAQWVGGYLAFPGRIEREGWIDQAKELASGKLTEFAERVKRGEVASSRDDDPEHDDPHSDLGALNEKARPQGLVGPRAGGADDLALIRGVGPQIQGKLHELGIWHFDQIGSLSDAELNFVAAFVGAPGRAVRDNWSGESRILASGGETEHSRSVKASRR